MTLLYDAINIYSTFISTYTLFTSVCFYLDYNHIYENKKLFNRSKEEYLQIYKESLPLVFKNVYLYSFPYIYSVIYVNNLIHGSYREYSDNNFIFLLQIIFNFIGFRLIVETTFHLSHFFMHTKYLYKFHKVHHEIKNPVSITTLYMHPLDLYLSNLSPFALSTFILNYDILTGQIFIIIQLIQSILLAHNGYKNLSEHHNIHHTLFKYNYGSEIIDKYFNTQYIKDKKK